MNILLITFFVGFMVSEIPRVSVFRHCPYSVIFPYIIPMLYDFVIILIYTYVIGLVKYRLRITTFFYVH